MSDAYRVVPDIHEKDISHLLKCGGQGDEPLLFLGDWFDSFESTPDTVHRTIDAMLQAAEDPRTIFLWGNHDRPYGRPDSAVPCSGFKARTFEIIQRRVPQELWDRFKVWHWIGPTLLSHAGFWFDPRDPVCPPERRLCTMIGRARGGRDARGGPLWLDFQEEFDGAEDADGHLIPQVFGHSHVECPTFFKGGLCLDTNLRHTAIVYESGEIGVEEVRG